MRPRSRRSVLPGLVLAVLLAGVGFLGNRAAPLVSPLLTAIVLGVLVRNLGLVPQVAEPGLRVAARPVLRWGVVLLGLQLSVPQVVGLGWGVVAVIVGTVSLTYVAGVGLGRALGLPRSTRTLVAAGTAICGASAVAAMSAALRPEDDPAVEPGREGARAVPDVQESAAAAVATVTLFGTLALLGLPLIAGLLGMGEREAGVWIGAGVHEVGQVVAGAGLVGAGALDVAVLTKLGRVVLLAPMVAAVGIAESLRTRHRRGGSSGEARVTGGYVGGRITPPVPLFVVGFLVMVLARSLVPLPEALLEVGSLLATLLLTTAMVAMGAGIDLRTLVRSGGGALVLGALATLVSTATALAGVLLLV